MKVLLCSYFKFPKGDAGAIRHEKLALMLRSLGHDVFVVGLGKHCGFATEIYAGMKYTSLREKKTDFFGKLKSRVRYWGRLKKIIAAYQADSVLMDDMRPLVTVKLKKYCKKHGIKLIHDSVEWYSPEQFKLGALSFACVQKNILNRLLIDPSMRVISISSYLHNYYSKKGIDSVNIPVVLADCDLCKEKKLRSIVQFMYAGQPGKKDNLQMIVNAFALLPRELYGTFQVHVVGCTKEQMVASGVRADTIDRLGKSLEIHGRVAHEIVLELLKQIDFTLLMRSPEQVYAKAGFPTKVVESLSRSTPVIANLTSDLDRYLVDGYNALIVSEYTENALMETLEKAIKLSHSRREQMCLGAYSTAVEKLHSNLFVEDMEHILR